MDYPLPDPDLPLREHSEFLLLCMVLWGEARGTPEETREAIGHAIINRALHPGWWGRTLATVILKPWQFSSFNGPEVIRNIKPAAVDPNYRYLRNPLARETRATWNRCCATAERVYMRMRGAPDSPPDVTRSANHYYDTSIAAPKWADDRKFTVQFPASRTGRWVKFYRL